MLTVSQLAIQLEITLTIERAISYHPALPGANRHLWNIPITYPNRLQTAAGYCHYNPLRIDLHPGLLGPDAAKAEHVATFLHELAHAMSVMVYGIAAGRGHGEHWWEMMHQLGQRPQRTHKIAACRKASLVAKRTLDDMGL